MAKSRKNIPVPDPVPPPPAPTPVPGPVEIAKAWEEALSLWGVRLDLSPPDARARPPGKREAGAPEDPLAYIDLSSRQVVVDLDLLGSIGASASLAAVLAHEVGHHIRYPHTLGMLARLEVLEKRLMPPRSGSLVNLFLDLLVNEVVGRTLTEEILDVYRGFARTQGEPPPVFAFYLAIYEELWIRPPGELVFPPVEARMDKKFPGWRAEARMFAQTFWALPEIRLQFVYFCSRFARFLEASKPPKSGIPMASDLPEPGADDFADALEPDPQAERALHEARERGWIDKAVAPAETGDDFAVVDRLCGEGHGRGSAPFRRAIVDRFYRRHIEKHLIEIPPVEGPPPDPLVPVTTEPWEIGDDPAWIDWTQSVLTAGPLAAVAPLRREFEADEPAAVAREVPWVEIYLDTSGSMPNPLNGLNAMTLAAQVLSAAALRKGARVRAVIYSYGPPLVSDWMLDEDTAREFLFHYAGGGTQFPFRVLQTHAEETPGVIRVLVSDSGFLEDMKRPEGKVALARALERSRLVVALLNLWPGWEKALPGALGKAREHPAFRLVPVPDARKLAEAAAELGRALFGKGS
ncbi:MAG: hypothetical protein MUC63_08160 [Planctomycetes bacterium]|jgi:hypothetical protein|nr:hypothetical protein [Planctomycetota bacterium]